MPVPLPPSAPRRPHPLAAHGVTRTDDWYWLADRDDPAVIDYLRAENEYADAVLAPMDPLQRRLFEEIRNRVQETDAGPPFRHGPWWYFSRTVRGQQYPIMCRRADRDRSLVGAGRRPRRPLTGGRNSTSRCCSTRNACWRRPVTTWSGCSTSAPITPPWPMPPTSTVRSPTPCASRTWHPAQTTPIHRGGVLRLGLGHGVNLTLFYVRPDERCDRVQVWRHRLGGRSGRTCWSIEEDDERFFV